MDPVSFMQREISQLIDSGVEYKVPLLLLVLVVVVVVVVIDSGVEYKVSASSSK